MWYNPRCGTCRKVKGLLEAEGVGLDLVEYLKGRVSRAEWARLVEAVGGEPARLLRSREPLFRDLKLGEKIAAGKMGREEVVELLHKHPRLLERPVVELGGRCLIARPAEKVRELLGRG